MEDLKNKLNHAKDRIVGQGKEAAGKIFDDSQLELKGKLQSAKAEILENIEDGMEDIKDGFDEVKDGVAKKINNLLDKRDKSK